MFQLFVVTAGIILGVVLIVFLPPPPTQKLKVDEDTTQKINNKVVNEEQKKPQSDITNHEGVTNRAEIQKAQSRRDKMMRNLSEEVQQYRLSQEKELVSNFFKSRAEEIIDGKAPSDEERRFRFMMTLFGLGTYVVFFVVLIVIVILMFGTTDIKQIKYGFELIAIRIMGYFQGLIGNPNQFS